MQSTNITYLSIYKEKRAVQKLYSTYKKSYYSKALYEQFCIELVQWYDLEAQVDEDVLENAMSAFRYSVKVYM